MLVFFDPAVAALIGWLIAMTTRQAGHFFFEPKGYDHNNHATHEHKEEIKVGYNLQRKVVLLTIWALSPLVLLVDPTLFGIIDPYQGVADFIRQTAKIWLALGIAGLLVADDPAVLHQGRADRPGLGDQDPHRSIPRREALLQGADVPVRRASWSIPNHGKHRSDDAEDEGRRGRAEAANHLKRWASISFSNERLIDLLVVAGSDHHQPSRSISVAAMTNRSATAVKSSSL